MYIFKIQILNRMKNTFHLMVLMLLCTSVSSQIVHSDYALKTAKAYFNAKMPLQSNINLNYYLIESTDTLLFVFNNGANGYVVMAGDMSVDPVLAYSDEAAFDADNINPGLELWLKWYASQVSQARSKSTKSAHPNWAVINNSLLSLNNGKAKDVTPLVAARWNQDNLYNYNCPEHPNGPGGHCYAGCVSTAMSMIMYYYKYPESGYNSHAYYHPYYGTISADFGQTTYDWSSMTNIINTSSKEAISKLMYHCGISVDMYYTPVGSSAFSENTVYAFKHYFNYRLTVESVDKDAYDYLDWYAIIQNELDEGRPILYSGSGSSGGHAFVCDGYQDTLFHFNWGWGGANNGYFRVDSLDSGNGDFTVSQIAVIGIIPYDAPYCKTSRICTDSSGKISDGSAESYYWNNTNCGWLIQPSNGDVILNFTSFNTEAGKDVVNVYDGTSTSGTLLGAFSGTAIPPQVVASSGSMFIVFTSDGVNQGEGWTATYTCGHVGLQENQLFGSFFFPNPTDENIQFSSPENEEILICKIFNSSGQLVFSDKNLIGNNISLAGLPQGLYFVTVETASGFFSGKVLKQK